MTQALIFVIFPFCLAVAAFSDFFTMTIPNRVSAILLGAFFLAAPLAGLGLRARRERADLAVGEGERALVALVGAAHGLELVEARGGGRGGERRGDGVVDDRRVEGGDLDGVVAGVGS